jgi:hypothetical protein
MTRHYSEDELVLFFYGECRRGHVVAAHLDDCTQCADFYSEIASTLRLLTPPEAPPRDERYGLEVWQRIRPHLPAASPSHWTAWWFANRLAAAGIAAAVILLTVVMTQRWPRTRAEPVVSVSPNVIETVEAVDRMRMAAITDHLEESERLLLDFVNAGGRVVDISRQTQLASDLIEANRLYREAATSAGDRGVADVLDALERSLTEIAHAPQTISPTEFDVMRARLDADDVLFKVRVLADELQERQLSPLMLSKEA